LCESLAAQDSARSATDFMMLTTALGITLHRWTGQDDLVVGTVAAGRTQRQVENLIGCFMNFVPLRLRISKAARAADLLSEVKQTILEAFAHQDCPFDKIVEAINPARGVHRNPLYNVALLLQNFPQGVLNTDVLRTEFVPVETNTHLLDLRFIAEPNEEGMRVVCEYDTALFDKSTIEALMRAFESVLRRLIESPESLVSEMELPQPLLIQSTTVRARRQVETVALAATFTADEGFLCSL
jgi:non-ribosomal peptide synthetase component F